jgi:hypothetical protein
MKTILINQPRGLGDILFSQKIIHKLVENNYFVYWFTNEYFWLKDYINIKNFEFTNHILPTDFFLNLQDSIEENHPYDIMTCKYKMIGKTLPNLPENLHNIDYTDWELYFNFERNFQKENELFSNILNLDDNEEYILLNRRYGINQYKNEILNEISNKNKKTIELSYISNYTLFDWCKVIENATEIYTVDTSILMLIEKLKLKSKTNILYPRHHEHTPKCLNKLFKTDWTWRL